MSPTVPFSRPEKRRTAYAYVPTHLSVVVDGVLARQWHLRVEVVVRDGVARQPVEAVQTHLRALLQRQHDLHDHTAAAAPRQPTIRC